jgi:hypothetical protein
MEIPYQQTYSRKPAGSLAHLVLANSSICMLLTCSARGDVTISPDHPELLQQGILAAYAAGRKVGCRSGGCLPDSATGERIHLDLENLTDFEIDARGATFVFQDVNATGVLFYNCDGVLFHDATLILRNPAVQ